MVERDHFAHVLRSEAVSVTVLSENWRSLKHYLCLYTCILVYLNLQQRLKSWLILEVTVAE